MLYTDSSKDTVVTDGGGKALYGPETNVSESLGKLSKQSYRPLEEISFWKMRKLLDHVWES